MQSKEGGWKWTLGRDSESSVQTREGEDQATGNEVLAGHADEKLHRQHAKSSKEQVRHWELVKAWDKGEHKHTTELKEPEMQD